MDPNETLRRLRAGLSQLTPSDGDASWFKDNSAAIELIIESSVDLDDWLSKGGFYPEDWAHSSRATARQARLDGYADGSANN